MAPILRVASRSGCRRARGSLPGSCLDLELPSHSRRRCTTTTHDDRGGGMSFTSVRALLVVLALAATAAVAAATARADVSQTPVTTACATGFQRLGVAAMEAIGPYYVPRLVDTAGNGDGYVCGLA